MRRFAWMLGVLAGCGSGAEPASAPKARFRGDILDSATGQAIMKVRLAAPASLPAERSLGLIFVCHGFRGHENNSYLDETVKALQRQGLADQYLVVAGKSLGEGWTKDDDARLLRLVDRLKADWPLDPRRIFLFGSSNGSAFVNRFAYEHPELVTAVVSYCGAYDFSKSPAPASPAGPKPDWYIVHGGNDRAEASRRMADELSKRGYRYVFRRLDGYGHTDIWDGKGHPDLSAVDAVRDDWALWLHALRHDLMEAPAEPGNLAEAARIGGSEGGRFILNAFASPSEEDRAAAAEACAATLFGGDVLEGLVNLLADRSERVRTAAFRALAARATWRHSEAQKALVGAATARGFEAARRLPAVEGLARAARLGFLGNTEDGLLYWTLVGLLQDDEPAVREAAFAVLEKGAGNAFGYKPDLPPAERAAAAGRWKAWCAERCGPLESVGRPR
jgi:alpha-beta hydrolase superfamily lysophospholipase